MRWTLAMILVAGAALAQSTGGSFGGGSFHGSDGPSGAGGGRSSGGPSGSPGSSTFPSSTGSGSGPIAPLIQHREPTAAERERERKYRSEQEARERLWLSQHRRAGEVALTADERVAFTSRGDLELMLWPFSAFGVLAFLLYVCLSARFTQTSPKTLFASQARAVPQRSAPAQPPGPSRLGLVYISRISLAFDWTSRRALQSALHKLAIELDLRTSYRRQFAVEQVVRRLEQDLGAVRYAGWKTWFGLRGRAESRFAELTSDLRGRYSTEVVRNLRRSEAPEVRARAREGQGLVVISILIGRNGLPPLLPRKITPCTVGQALERLARGKGVEVLEVIWSPGVDDDRMSSAELEVIYPELVPLDESAVGRVACPSCSTVYARELEQCPGCGDRSTPTSARDAVATSCPYCAAPMPRSETRCEACGAWVAASASDGERSA
jgi:uncharacterized membrane protein